jgi:hypothetical protein
MANIFAPLVRPHGVIPLSVDTGPIIDGVEYMHMWISQEGNLQASLDEIHHFGAGLPFDFYGRVVVSTDNQSAVDVKRQTLPVMVDFI